MFRAVALWLVVAWAMLALPATARGQATVVAAGDIACSPRSTAFTAGLGSFGPEPECHQKYTSDLFETLAPTVVLPLGDTQYGQASYADYLNSYAREDSSGTAISWGSALAISRPVPGNHEYANRDPTTGSYTGAGGYFDYFNGVGAATGRAGDRDKGYYSYDVQVGTRPDGTPVTWHLVAINSQCAAGTAAAQATGWREGCAPGSAQERWLRTDLSLASATTDCTLAYWHHPRFSATGGGDNAVMAPVWQALLDNYADVVLTGHHHNYQRLGPLDASGSVVPGVGIREFVVGTGGRSLGTPKRLTREVEAFDNKTFGVLKLTLHDGWYAWQFVAAQNSGTFTDSGRGGCVKPPPTITSGPDGIVLPASAHLSFTAGRGTSAFQCRLDGGTWQPCASPARYSELSSGEHTFEVRAVDSTGLAESPVASRRFLVDATPPHVRLTAPSQTHRLSKTVTLSADATDASGVARVDWLLDGRPIASDSAPPWSQPWNSRRIRDGEHELVVNALDAVGNAGTSGPVKITVGNTRHLRAALRMRAPATPRSLIVEGLHLQVRCSPPCRTEARLRLTRRVARRLGMPVTLARRFDRRLRREHRIFVRPRRTTRRRLGRERTLALKLELRATDRLGDDRLIRRSIRLRRGR